MIHMLTVKSQVTIPKAIRLALNIAPGDSVRFADEGALGIRLYAIKANQKTVNLTGLKALRGSATRRLTTEEVMRMTRGDDWNTP
jgi:antitoxin PrlF